MKKSMITLAIAGLSTAALAQSNVTIYGTADVSAQGTTLSRNSSTTQNPTGSSFNLKANDSLLGFKGTESLGNGNKALFQLESYVNVTGGQQGVAANNGNLFGSMRDSYVGFGSKYGTVLGGYLSTPYRATLVSYDVFPGDRSDSVLLNTMGKQRYGYGNGNGGTGYIQADNAVRATALVYAMPTIYGVNGSIAYTGSNNNGSNNQTNNIGGVNTQTTLAPQNALSMNLGWAGYGFGVNGAFQQAKVNASVDGVQQAYSGYTSYMVGTQYTGVPGLKAAVAYNRNSLGLNADVTNGAQKGSNNQIYAGLSYRFGNNEPRISYINTSNTSGFSNSAGQDGGSQWNLGWGYYLSKRTQVYGVAAQYRNNANGVWSPMQTGTNMLPTGGQTFTTYGAGLRTNF